MAALLKGARINPTAKSRYYLIMKTALSIGTVLLMFPGVTKAATQDVKAPLVLVQAKFVEVTDKNVGPSGGVPLPAPLGAARKVPGPVGVLNDPEFQTLIRGISSRKGVDLMSAPGLKARAGQQAKVEVVREFAYKDADGKPATGKTGVTLEVTPQVTEEGQIHLALSPQVVEVDGYVNHPGGWEEPVFSERKASERVTLTTGQTFVLELASRTDQQTVEEEDAAGRVISSRTDKFTRRTLVFVTTFLLDPVTGKPRSPKDSMPKGSK